MKSLKTLMIEAKVQKAAKRAAFPPKKPPINNRLIAMMLLPNDFIQGLIVGATQSTYVPVPKGDGRPLAMLHRTRKEDKRRRDWQGIVA